MIIRKPATSCFTFELAVIAATLVFSLFFADQAMGNTSADKKMSGSTENAKKGAADPKERLKEIEKNRHELQTRLQAARLQEKKALQQLNQIKSKLNNTTHELNSHQHQLKKTERNLEQTQDNLNKTTNAEQRHEELAAVRLKEIYEGQRLGLVEMLFEVKSLQDILDLMYYQEKIAAQDSQIIRELKERALALHAQKNRLGNQKNVLGDLVSEFARKAMALNKEKSAQEQIADKMRTQRAFYEQAERQLAHESMMLEQQIMSMINANKKSATPAVQGSGHMSMPIKAAITSPFGWRRHPIFGVRKYHTGVDLAGPNRSAIKAADDGNVLYAGWYGGYGKVVIVNHGNGLATLYAHMSKTAVSVGANIKKGDVVGYEGSTGFSTGPHLHFEVRVDGKPNNPLNYVK